MADEDIQKEPPEGIRMEPPRAEAPPRSPEDDNRFRRSDPVRNSSARIALWLGVFSAIPLFLGVGTIGNPELFGGYAVWLGNAGLLNELIVCLGLVLGPAAFRFGILGVRYLNRHSTAGGSASAIFGIVMGFLSFICFLGGLWVQLVAFGRAMRGAIGFG